MLYFAPNRTATSYIVKLPTPGIFPIRLFISECSDSKSLTCEGNIHKLYEPPNLFITSAFAFVGICLWEIHRLWRIESHFGGNRT